MTDDHKRIAAINKERAIFLKQLAQEPDTHVVDLADRIGTSSDRAWAYVRAFLKVLSQEYDMSNPEKLKSWVNQYVEPEFALSEHDIANLTPLLEKYPDLSYKKPEQVIIEQPVMSTNEQNNPSEKPEELNKVPQGQPGQGQGPPPGQDEFGQPEVRPAEYGAFNLNQLNRKYDLSWIPQLERHGLMRFVLQRVPASIPTHKIEAFIQTFYINQDDYMASPDTLRRELRDYFGEKTGEQAAHAFLQYITQLPPSEGFGVRKSQGLRGVPNGQPLNFNPANPFTQGSSFENPFDTYYHREGVLGFGQDIRSNSAMRQIYEFEQQKRKDKESERKRDKMMDDVRQSMQLQMADFMNSLKNGGKGGGGFGGGGSGMEAMFWPMMMTAMSNGRLQMEPYTDANGAQQIRMVSQPGGGNGHGYMSDPNVMTTKDMLTLMQDFYGKLDAKSTENSTLRDRILENVMSQFGEKKSFIEQAVDFKKLMNEFQPPQGLGGVGPALEIAKVMLEKEKVVGDRERADKMIERQFNEKKEMQTIELEKEKEANKTKNAMIKGITSMIGASAPTLFQLIMLLTGRGGVQPGVSIPGQTGQSSPLGGIMNMVSTLLGGGGGGNLLGGLLGGGGGEGEEEEGGGGGAESPFAGLGSIFSRPATGAQQQPQQAQPQQQAKSYSSVPTSEESFDIRDIMSSVQNMFGFGSTQQEQQPQQQPQQQTSMPFQGIAAGPVMPDQSFTPPQAYNRNPLNQVGGVAVVANAFDDVETTTKTNIPFRVETNLPPYQQQFNYAGPGPNSGTSAPTYAQTQRQEPQQQQPQPQAPQEEDPFRIYQEQDFMNTPKENLKQYEDEAKRSLASVESYLKSIQNVMNHSSSS